MTTMAKYDFKAAKKYIQMHSDLIDEASMGMDEDWFWTAEDVYKDGSFTKDLDQDDLKLGGINGSPWATPTLEVTFKDGTVVKKDCYVGEANQQPKPSWFSLGVSSQPVQDIRDEKFIENQSGK